MSFRVISRFMTIGAHRRPKRLTIVFINRVKSSSATYAGVFAIAHLHRAIG